MIPAIINTNMNTVPMIKTRPGAQLATCIINLPIDDDCTNHPQEDSTKRLTKRKLVHQTTGYL